MAVIRYMGPIRFVPTYLRRTGLKKAIKKMSPKMYPKVRCKQLARINILAESCNISNKELKVIVREVKLVLKSN